MELVIMLAVLAAVLWFFVFRNKKDVSEALAPYKVEAPIIEPVAPTVTESVKQEVVAEPVAIAPVEAKPEIAAKPQRAAKSTTTKAAAMKPKTAGPTKAPVKDKAKKPKMSVAK